MGKPRSRRRTARVNPSGVIRCSSSGYGFVHTAEGDFFIPASKINGAIDGDKVEVARLGASRKDGSNKRSDQDDKARVVRVIRRAQAEIVGVYEYADPLGIVVPRDSKIPYDIFVLKEDSLGAQDGDLVSVEIISYPSRNAPAVGAVKQLLGSSDDAKSGTDLLISAAKIRTEFPEEVIKEAAECALDESHALLEGYKDLRNDLIFTVDPSDARDFDDAISIEKCDDKWHLGIHIADVSAYVHWGSVIDLEARMRGCSVYLPDRVIPMIPEALSNNLCSLVPGEVRQSLSLEVVMDSNYEVLSYEIVPALIESKFRLSYDDAWDIIEGRARSFPDELCQRVIWASELSASLQSNRQQCGMLSMDTKEVKFGLNKEGYPENIYFKEKNQATSMIEHIMILANILVAQYLKKRELPGIYRVHDAPDAELLRDILPVLGKMDIFKDFEILKVSNLSKVSLASTKRTHRIISDVLLASESCPEHEVVAFSVLRAMKQAYYSHESSLHYGLSAQDYSHFTSPIRRYPDLELHRLVKATLFGRSELYSQEVANLPLISKHSSQMEREAIKLERKVSSYYMAMYMQQRVGEVFECIISGVKSNGIYVRFQNTAEAFISLRKLGREYFAYDGRVGTLQGQESGKCYKLGGRLKVQLRDVLLPEGKLDVKLT